MVNNYTIEICVGNIFDAIKASEFPIDRIELNAAIELGGLTPSLETLKYLKKTITPKIVCMVRPRGGDFIYTDIEYKIMLKDAKNFLDNGADGIVFGFNTKDNHIDLEKTTKIVELIHSYKKEAIFHKAFDELDDLDIASMQLTQIGVDRILTSGKAVYPDILKGCEIIKELKNKYKTIQYLPGGGVRIENVKDVLKVSGSNQIHMTSKRQNDGGYLEFDKKQLEKIINKIKEL